MDVVLEHAWAAAQRGAPLSVLLLDLDGFKLVNDQRGHAEGDRILIAVADALRSEVRGSDVAVRYGGDEFLVILPGGDELSALSLAERLLPRIRELIGASIGIAGYSEDMADGYDLIREADNRLYTSKRNRRALR
jgi:diguanylate cyclase (GGDEF)-like protein